MQNFFEQRHTVHYSEVDGQYRLRLDSVLSTFQKLTFFHSQLMEVDGPTLAARSGAFWVLSRIKYEIRRLPKMGERLVQRTWPTTVTPFRFLRDYTVHDEVGDALILGTSEWCTLDIESRTLRKSSTVAYPYEMEHLPARSGCTPFAKIRGLLENAVLHHTHVVRFGDLDSNGHTNNVVYMRMVLDTFTPESFFGANIREIELEYTAQSYFGDEVAVYRSDCEFGLYIEGRIGEKKIFHCVLKMDKSE